jgi:hypothetical protein
MVEGTLCELTARIDLESNGSNLHVEDRLMTVAALRRRGQADHVSRRDLGENALKRDGWQVVALIDNHLPILGDAIVHGVFSGQALNHGDIDLSGQLALSTAKLIDRFRILAKKYADLRSPLFQQRLSVYQDQGAAFALCDKISSKDGFSKTRWRHDHAVVVFEYGLRCLVLGVGQLAQEHRFERITSVSQVFQLEAALVFSEQHLHVVQTSPRQADVLIVILDAGDHTGRQCRRQAEILLLVELRILECGETFDLVEKG